MSATIAIEEAGFSSGCCAGRGNASRTVLGYAYCAGRCVAASLVQWTLGRISEHGANFDLIIGDFGDCASDEDRRLLTVFSPIGQNSWSSTLNRELFQRGRRPARLCRDRR